MQIIYFTIENKIILKPQLWTKLNAMYVFRRLKIIGRNPKCDHDRRKKIEKKKLKKKKKIFGKKKRF